MEPIGIFDRGKTYYGDTATIDTSNYGTSGGLEGLTKGFKDIVPSTKLMRSSRPVTAIAVRNVSGITLFKGMAVTWASGYRGRRVNGYTRLTAAEAAGIVDDQLPSSGVRNGDIFWLIVKGPCLCYTPIGAGATNVWSEGDKLYALTAAASTANTTGGTTADESGHLQPFTSLTATSTQTTDGTLASILANKVGVAMSAATTANSMTEKLVDLQLAG